MLGKSINEEYGENLIDRAPDKMVDLLQGRLILAYRNVLIYADID